MEKKSKFKQYTLNIFCEKYNIDRHQIRKVVNGDIEEFKGWSMSSSYPVIQMEINMSADQFMPGGK
jgi:hypothetical protein